MTAKIVPIRGAEILQVLEQWLEQAKRGEMKAVAFACVMSDGTTCEGWFGRTGECAVELYGALNIARDQYFHSLIEHYDHSSI